MDILRHSNSTGYHSLSASWLEEKLNRHDMPAEGTGLNYSIGVDVRHHPSLPKQHEQKRDRRTWNVVWTIKTFLTAHVTPIVLSLLLY